MSTSGLQTASALWTGLEDSKPYEEPETNSLSNLKHLAYFMILLVHSHS